MRPLGLPRVKLCPRLSVTGAAACKTLGKGTGEARQAPRARGERRRHTITNGVDCSLVRGARTLRDSVYPEGWKPGRSHGPGYLGNPCRRTGQLFPFLGLREDRQSQAQGEEAP
jgi:hypothetical protein